MIRRQRAAAPLVHPCQNRLLADTPDGAPRYCGKPARRRRFHWWLCDECAKGAHWLHVDLREDQTG